MVLGFLCKMRCSSDDKVGSFLTSCAILLVAVLYAVSFEPVTCSPSNRPARNINNLTQTERGTVLIITLNVTGMNPEERQNALEVLQQEMICNSRRAKGRRLPAYCFDTTTTTENLATSMESTLEITTTSAGATSSRVDPTTTVEVETTTSEVVATTIPPSPARPIDLRRRRNVVGKDSISDQNLQSRIHFAPGADPDGKRKRRDASSATETDCDELDYVDDGPNVRDGILIISIFQPDDCGENDTTIEDLEEAANATKFNGRFEERTKATILDFERGDIDYFTTEGITTVTTAILTTEETTITKAILTTEETTITSTILTTTADNIVTTSYSTYPAMNEITTAAEDILTSTADNTVEALNSTLWPPVTPLVNYKTWLPILIVLIVLLITFIFLCCYQKGKKQSRRRPTVNQAQPTTSEAANGPRPQTRSNGPSPREVDADAGLLIPMNQFSNE